RHLRGCSTFIDQVEIPPSDQEPRFPLPEHLWLRAVTAARVTVCDTGTMIRSSDPWAGLDLFHRAILDFIAEIQKREAHTRRLDLERAITHESALAGSVASQLMLASGEAAALAFDPEGDALLRACSAVGQHMGIEVHAPRMTGSPGSELPGDLLGDLA